MEQSENRITENTTPVAEQDEHADPGNEHADPGDEHADSGNEHAHPGNRKGGRRFISSAIKWIMNLIGLSVMGYGLYWVAGLLIELDEFESTDDAQVEQYITPINIKVPGYIRKVRFSEHQYVKKGDVLVELNDEELKIQLAQAEATLKDALTGREVLDVNAKKSENSISVLNSSIAELKIRMEKLKSDYARQDKLLKQNATTLERVEKLQIELEAMDMKLNGLKTQKRMARLGVTEVSKKEGNVEAAILRAKSAVDMAKLHLSYAVIKAPCSGWLGRRTMTEGQLVNAGQTVTYIIPDTPKWIVANFKESQMKNLHVDQPVQITVDAFEQKRFSGKISKIAEATGSKFSLVPTDNATGNFVKIQQRIPVKIEFENLSVKDNELLAVGMMAVVKVAI